MLSNDDKAIKTSNLFEHIQIEDINEDITDTNLSRDTDAHIKRKQIDSKPKSYKKNKNRRQKNSNHKKVQKKSPVKRNKTLSNIEVKRCCGCHVDHFPLPKFCRWWEKRRVLRKVKIQGTEQLNVETIMLVKKCIKILEEKFDGITVYSKNDLVNNFFIRSKDSCKPKEFPDLFNLKLRGGGNKQHKVGIKSNNNALDCVFSLFRDMVPLWHEIDSHLLCDHKLEPSCFYCLLRSLSLRSMNPQVRTPISAIEVLPRLEEENIDKLQIQDMVTLMMNFNKL